MATTNFQQWFKNHLTKLNCEQKRQQKHDKKVIKAFKEISRINKFSRD